MVLAITTNQCEFLVLMELFQLFKKISITYEVHSKYF